MNGNAFSEGVDAMIVTTIDLLNYLRCRRFAALDTRMQARQTDRIRMDEKYSSLKYLAASSRAVSALEEEDPTDAEQKKQFHQDTVAKAVYQMKAVAQKKIQAIAPELLLSLSQKVSTDFAPDITLSARLDFLGSYSDTLATFTVIPATDREWIQWKYHLGKERKSFFVKNEQRDLYQVAPVPGGSQKTNFNERMTKLADRRHELGRYVYDLTYKSFILRKLYPNQTIRSFLILLNHGFVLGDQSLSEEDTDLVSLFDLTPVVNEAQSAIEVDLYRMVNHIHLNDDSPCPLVKNECQRGTPFECPFADYCFSHIPKENSVFSYFMHHLGFAEGPAKTDPVHDTYELVNSGVVGMLDVPISWLQREKNLMQRYCVENEYTFVNKSKIKALVETLRYPLYYLDFEAYPAILPRFRGESPYSQSVFQFSVFVDEQPGKLDPRNPATHFEYLAPDGEDHREELILALLNAIPPGDTPIVVYNQTFEKNRLEELAWLFPVHAARIRELQGRLFDLLRVLKTDYDFYVARGFSKSAADSYNYYHPSQSGSYSLKKILPAFDPKGYSGFPIADGMTAYQQFARMSEMEPEERQKTREQLLAYCKQDTWAMAVILHGLEKRL
jgi:hypothetical protein